jgi:uncharacterized membrane protein
LPRRRVGEAARGALGHTLHKPALSLPKGRMRATPQMGIYQQPAREGAMEEREKSSTGLDENVAGFLCYLFVFITGIVFLVVEKKSSFVKFHARQSTVTFLILLVLSWIPVIGFLFWILGIFLWLLLMIKTLQGQKYVLPIVGKMADRKTNQ